MLREAAGRAAPGSDRWCAAQIWLGWAAGTSADPAGALGHFTAVRDAIGDRGPSRALADCLGGRSVQLANLGRIPEAVDDGRRCLALARELSYPAAEAMALGGLCVAAWYVGDLDGALRLARQAEQITADIPGWIARGAASFDVMLIAVGELAARRAHLHGGAGPVPGRGRPVEPTGPAGGECRTWICRRAAPTDAAAHLREALQVNLWAGEWFEMLYGLESCGYLCAATRRWAEAVTIWAALVAVRRRMGLKTLPRMRAVGRKHCARPGRRSGRPSPGGRGTRHRDEPGDRGRVRPDAYRPRRAAIPGCDGPR